MSRTTRSLARRMRDRREAAQFSAAVRGASPAMQQELLAMAARQHYSR
jgi:hypothetical protein